MEVGKQRQRILKNLRAAYEKKDMQGVLVCVEEMIGLDDKTKGPSEKSH